MGEGRADKPEDFYAAIGRTLTVWSSLENALCTLFCRCVGPENSFPTNRAFWSILAFDDKLKTVDAVMRARFDREKDLGKVWNDLRKQIIKLNESRNKIAHGTVITMPYLDRETKKQFDDLFFAPYFWGTLGQKAVLVKGDLRPFDRMYRKDIQDSCQQFDAMTDKLDTVAAEVFAAIHKAKAEGRTLDTGPVMWHEGADPEIDELPNKKE